MTELEKPPELAKRGGIWVRSGAVEIHLGVEAEFRPARKAHPGIVVADIDGARGAASGCRSRRRSGTTPSPACGASLPPTRSATGSNSSGATTTMAETAFASTGDLAEKTVTFAEIGAGLYAYTAEGDPNSGIIVGDDGCMVDRRAGDAGDGEGRDRARRRGHRQADPLRRAVALSRRAGARRLSLRRARHRRLGRDLPAHRRARARGLGFGVWPLPAPVPRRRVDPGPDLADAHLRGRDVGLPRAPRGQAPPPRRRPHGGRHRRLGSGRRGDVLGRSRRVPLGLLLRRRASARMALDPRSDPRLRPARRSCPAAATRSRAGRRCARRSP